jgi:DNA repair protein RadC
MRDLPRRKRAALCTAQTDFAALLFETTDSLRSGDNSATVHEGTVLLAGSADTASWDVLMPVYGVKLVRLGSLLWKERPRIRGPADAVGFVAVLLDTKGQVIGVTTISIGDLSSALVHPREVFKPAVLANAASVLLAHNHPSGDPTPSSEDVSVTRRLAEAGALLGIDVLDHVVIGERGHWVSLRERGLYDFPSAANGQTGEVAHDRGMIP